MSGSGNGEALYRISMSRKIAEYIKRILRDALIRGVANKYVAALEEIQRRLRRDPDVFGEPRYHLKHMKLQVRVGAILPLAVIYGVNADLKVVFVANFRDLRGDASEE